MRLGLVLVLAASAIAMPDPKAWDLQRGLAQLKQGGAKIASLVGAKATDVAAVDPESQVQKLVHAFNEGTGTASELIISASELQFITTFTDARDRVAQVGIPRAAYEILEQGKDAFIAVKWDQLPAELRDWIVKNPWQTTFLVVNGIVYFYPGVAMLPLLRLAGFTTKGPKAFSLAAKLHSKIGNVPAGHVFSFLQSAAANGYGVAPISRAVRVSVAAADAVLILGRVKSKETRDALGESEGSDVIEGEGTLVGEQNDVVRSACPETGDVKSKL